MGKTLKEKEKPLALISTSENWNFIIVSFPRWTCDFNNLEGCMDSVPAFLGVLTKALFM